MRSEVAKENEANMAVAVVGGVPSKEVRSPKGLKAWFAKQQVKWCIAIMVALTLLGSALAGTFLLFGTGEGREPLPRLMRLWPKPNMDDHIYAFRHGPLETDGKDWGKLVESIDKVLSAYSPSRAHSGNVTECFGAQPPEGMSCFFDVGTLSQSCAPGSGYGYEQGTPCVFLQFPNIVGWKPEQFTTQDLTERKELPEALKKSYRGNVAFLDCQGLTLVDRENLGQVEYSPDRGFKTNFFPYTGQSDYMAPLVAVRFPNPMHGLAINVVCKLWAKNIGHKEHPPPSGAIYFTLLID